MRFLGHGEPEKAVWFIGLEYASGDESAAGALEHYATFGEVERPACSPDFSKYGRNGLSIRHLTSRILKWVSRSGANHEPEWFLENRLWWPGSDTFQANLFPLAKPNHSPVLPESYRREFGLVDWKDYRRKVVEDRLPRLRRLWEASAQKAVVCFGDEGELFRTLFDLEGPGEELIPGRVVTYELQRVVLTPFLDFRVFSLEDADRVGAYLRDVLKVEIP